VSPSGQGKAGALWGTTFPLLHPLPSPRNTPSLAPVSTRDTRPSLRLRPRSREPPLFLRPERWNASRLAGQGVSGKRASKSYPRVLELSARGLGARKRKEGRAAQGGALSRFERRATPPPVVRRAWYFRTEGPRSGSRQPIRSRGPRKGQRPGERPGRGRRHLADNSQVSDKAARRTEGSGGFERTAFQDAFTSFKRKIGRFSKTKNMAPGVLSF